MYRRHILKASGGIISLGVLGATPALAHKDNHRRSEAELVDLDPGDVVEKTSDPSQSNFDEQFTFWRVNHGIDYDESEYREPARTGPEVFHGGGSSVGANWFGVSAPDEDGIQHPIDHKGEAAWYLGVDTDDDGEADEWYELRAQFNGKNELLNVNGVEPQ